MSIIRLISACCLSAVAFGAHAGSAPESFSERNGYFLAAGFPAYISVGQPPAYLDEFRAICKQHGRLWALGMPQAFHCNGMQRLQEGGDGPVFELDIDSRQSAQQPKHALLFSSRPFAAPSWTIRPLDNEDIQRLQQAAILQPPRYKAALTKLTRGKAIAVLPRQADLKIYILPWRSSSDGVVEDEDYLIVLSTPGSMTMQQLHGRIVGYADLDGDGIPELQTTTHCDGTCEAVVSVRDLHQLLRISNH